jgi:hypothetical protein
MWDIAHLLRPGHLGQLRAILDDPEASGNDRFVALDLLKNACIAASAAWLAPWGNPVAAARACARTALRLVTKPASTPRKIPSTAVAAGSLAAKA